MRRGGVTTGRAALRASAGATFGPLAGSEHEHQARVIEWARWRANADPDFDLLYAVPNGGQRHAAVAAKLRAEGVRAGFPDLGWPIARGGFHGCYVEMKRPTESWRSVSADQRTWLRRLAVAGNFTVVCAGLDAARFVLDWYAGLPGSPSPNFGVAVDECPILGTGATAPPLRIERHEVNGVFVPMIRIDMARLRAREAA